MIARTTQSRVLHCRAQNIIAFAVDRTACGRVQVRPILSEGVEDVVIKIADEGGGVLPTPTRKQRTPHPYPHTPIPESLDPP